MSEVEQETRRRGASSRRKGIAFEREVAQAFAEHGWSVRGLESGGDHLAISSGDNLLFHIEAKRHEQAQVSLWLPKQAAECPPGAHRVLVWKRSGWEPYAIVPFSEYLEDVSR